MCWSILIYFHRQEFEPAYFFTIALSCYISTLVLHLYIQPGFKESLVRMRYLYENSENFENTVLPFSVNFMKLVIEISVQIVEVNTTYSLNDELWIIMCYSAMLCISWLD